MQCVAEGQRYQGVDGERVHPAEHPYHRVQRKIYDGQSIQVAFFLKKNNGYKTPADLLVQPGPERTSTFVSTHICAEVSKNVVPIYLFICISLRKRSFRDSEGRKVPNSPYVLIHRLCPELEVAVDSTTYGNNSRFCRTEDKAAANASHNAEVGGARLLVTII